MSWGSCSLASISITEKLAALRAASTTAAPVAGDSPYMHRDIYHNHLILSGRADVDFLLTRPPDEWAAILRAIEQDKNCIMRFLDDD